MKPLLTFIYCLFLAGTVHAQNPYESIGRHAEMLTLSNGQYQEFISNDTLVVIGSVLYNTMTEQIVGFAETDTVLINLGFEPEVRSRFLSVDPYASKYPSISPYAYVSNNPLIYIDPDGRTIIGVDGKPVTHHRDEESGKIIWSDNASEDIRRIGNAMLETSTGSQQLNAMIDSDVEITLNLSGEIKFSARGNLERGTTTYTDYTKNEDGSYTIHKALITIYEGSILAYMDKYAESNHVRIMNTVDRMVGGTAGHESVHVVDPVNASRSIQQARD
ncbi:MAG: hypothetical protein EA390_13705 [Balneolaceae bacterium]|nr:MAG: hypothetical protein EA390_13705 [Balneolaceae bacterium]